MAFSVSFWACIVIFLSANVGANKYMRRAAETKGVFPVLEANAEYELNKRAFQKRQSKYKAMEWVRWINFFWSNTADQCVRVYLNLF